MRKKTGKLLANNTSDKAKAKGEMMKIELDEQQTKAVHAPLENISVLAGAGSGKTRVIIERIAHMILCLGVLPINILAITYTRKASQEMRERLKKRLGAMYKKITLTTIHGFCHLQIYRFGDRIGWKPETMSVFSEIESRRMLDFTLNDLGYMKAGKFKKKGDVGKNMVNKAFERLGSHGEWPENEDVKAIMVSFFQSCKEANCLTYNMIITVFLDLLAINDVRAMIREEYPHIIVDEVQDTSRVQWSILNVLNPQSIFCTGDVRQSIMGFCGSDVENTINRMSDFHRFHIQSNYRSRRLIVEEGNRIMDDHVPMTTETSERGRFVTMLSTSEDIKDILFYVTKLGYGFGDIALLCRTHRPLAKSVNALRDTGASVYYPKEFDSIDKHPDKTVIHALLALAVNPYDLFSFMIVAAWYNLSPVETQEIRSIAKSTLVSYREACLERAGIDLSDILWPKFDQEVAAQIILEISEFEHEAPMNFDKYLKWYALRDMQFHQEDVPENHIQALSIHQSKGAEFPVVILIGANEGILPSSMCKSDEEIEEERRLYYVAVTRAQEVMIVSPRPESQISRFLSNPS